MTKPFIGVPPRVASFTGRDAELHHLDSVLLKEKPAAVTHIGVATVQGMGGIGKTTLATEYAHRYRGLYAGVCWCAAEQRTTLLTSLAHLAVTLGAARADEPDAAKAARMALDRLAEQPRPWLLIYDSVGSPEDIRDLLPSAGARVLITSRFQDWAELADQVSLDVLSPPEAAEFLQFRSGRSDAAGARALAETLGYLPLALDHAAAYCKRTQTGFLEYAAEVSSRLAAVPPQGVSYPRSVEATFNLALRDATARSPGSETLMAYLAQCGPDRIPMELVEGVKLDNNDRADGLAALVEASLVKRDAFEDGAAAITVHRVVQHVARSRSTARAAEPAAPASLSSRLCALFSRRRDRADVKQDFAKDASERFLVWLAASFPGDGFANPRSWPSCGRLTPHVRARRAAQVEQDTSSAIWAELLNHAGGYLHRRGTLPEAEQFFRDSLAVRERLFGSEDRRSLQSLNNLALVLRDQGDANTARKLFERALMLTEQASWSQEQDGAPILHNLGLVLMAQNDFAGARQLFGRTLAICESHNGAEHPATAASLNIIGLSHYYEHDFAAARPFLERALDIRERSLGPEDHETAESLCNLGAVFLGQHELEQAQPLLERAVAILDRKFGPAHPESMRRVITWHGCDWPAAGWTRHLRWRTQPWPAMNEISAGIIGGPNAPHGSPPMHSMLSAGPRRLRRCANVMD